MPDTLQARLSHTFRDATLLEQALTHPSYLQDNKNVQVSNQRLEFLGDAVLQLILTEALFEQFPQEREGGLTKLRSTFTKGEFLVQLAYKIQLEKALKLGGSEKQTGGRHRASSLEDAMEALIGAVYLDSDLETTRRFVLDLIGPLKEHLEEKGGAENPKGRLQEFAQARHGNQALRYDCIHVSGQDHAREYEATVFLLDQALGKGRGTSKKTAEEAAARQALATLSAS